jgi:hypothetical protein
VLGLDAGSCVLNANVASTANYNAATLVTQTFNVILEIVVPTYTDDELYNCNTNTSVTCASVTASKFGNVFQAEAPLRSNVEAVSQRTITCSENPWVSACNIDRVLEMNAINEQRMANLGLIIQNASMFRASCTTAGCTEVMNFVLSSYIAQGKFAGSGCASATCKMFASGLVDGLPSTFYLEKVRFDDYITFEQRQIVVDQTRQYSLCSTDSCRNSILSNKLNVSFAIWRYAEGAQTAGMFIQNRTSSTRALALDSLVASVDANYTICALGPCPVEFFNNVYFQKLRFQRYLVLWLERLDVLAASNSYPNEVPAERSATARDVYLMSLYLPEQIVVPGFLLYTLMLCAVITIGVLGFLWKTFGGKELFWLVLLGVALTCCLRIAFWAVGLQGVGTVSLTFVVIDKISSLLFALTILVFVFMWAKGIMVLADAPKILVTISAILAIVIAVTITAVTIVYAVSISRNFVQAFYGVYVADKAEITLACFTFVLIVALFVLILVVGFKLNRIQSDNAPSADNLRGTDLNDKLDEKIKNLKIIAVSVGVMVLLLTMRLVLVAIRNFYNGISLGLMMFYSVATLIPEIICCGIMLGLVLFTFYQSRNVGLKGMSTNSTYQSGRSESNQSQVEMEALRYEV